MKLSSENLAKFLRRIIQWLIVIFSLMLYGKKKMPAASSLVSGGSAKVFPQAMAEKPRRRSEEHDASGDGTLLVVNDSLLTKIKFYATLDFNIFGDSAYRGCLWIYGDSCRSGFYCEDYLLHIPGVFCDLFDYGRIQEVGLTLIKETG